VKVSLSYIIYIVINCLTDADIGQCLLMDFLLLVWFYILSFIC